MEINLNLNPDHIALAEVILAMLAFLIIGYLGGWLFKADTDLRGRYGIIIAIFLRYVVFMVQVWALIQLGASSDWLFTGAYVLAFVYRFFIRRGWCMTIDNWHTVIVLCLLSFGIGHAVFRARIGFWTFLLLIVFVSPLLLVYQEEKYYTLVLISLVVGFAYAHRQVVMDIVDDVLDGWRSFTNLFKRKPKQNNQHHQANHNQQNHYQQNQQAWQAEQERREQEAKEQRQRDKQRKQQQKSNQQTEQKKQGQQQQSRNGQHQQSSQQQSDAGSRSRYSTSKEVDNTEIDSRSPTEVLGLQPGFTPDELKKAYKRQSARCHPDKWANKPVAIRKMMEGEMKLVNWAYQQLK